jgi:endonuclease/exonuclease/phosphatase family metal-dependent hydrolase
MIILPLKFLSLSLCAAAHVIQLLNRTDTNEVGRTPRGELLRCRRRNEPKNLQSRSNLRGVPIRRSFIAAILTFLATINGSTGPAFADRVSVRVMTQNMYVGADFSALQSVTTPAELVAAVTQIYQNSLASKPAERAAAVARAIARERPDVVALQEAWIIRSGSAPATNVKSDQLEALLGALRQMRQPYEVVAILPNLDAEAPTLLGFDARFTDRTVIIGRPGLLGRSLTVGAPPILTLANIRVQDYLLNNVVTPPVGAPIVIRRGWASVELTISGYSFRLVTTHLDNSPPFAIQKAEAAEAIQSAVNTTLPTVFLGDFNAVGDDSSNPTFPTYQLIINAGFSDAWKQRNPTLPGFTCCQAPNLLNSNSILSFRIDYVFTRGVISVHDIHLVGNQTSDRTPSGLWPSDHAGLSATLTISD